MTDGKVFAALGREAIAEAVVPVAQQALGLELSAVHAMTEHFAIRARCQQVIVAGRNPYIRHATIMDTEIAATACRLHKGLEDAGMKEITAEIAGEEVGGISQHIAQLRVAGLIDGIGL